MYAYKCVTAYQGTRYNGWQRQGNTDRTIQGKLETVLSELLGEPVEIMGSGRTDAGVHALGQVFHFHCRRRLCGRPEYDSPDLLAGDGRVLSGQREAVPADAAGDSGVLSRQPAWEDGNDGFLSMLNERLPLDIRVLSMEECDLRFSARLHAVRKVYRYRIDRSAYGNPFLRETAWHVKEPLDLEAMEAAASELLGMHDFRSFCDNRRMKKSTERRIDEIRLEPKREEEELAITFAGSGFLYHMVRILTGTLIEVGLGQRKPPEMRQILEGMDRQLAGALAPAKGLCLVSVDYE